MSIELAYASLSHSGETVRYLLVDIPIEIICHKQMRIKPIALLAFVVIFQASVSICFADTPRFDCAKTKPLKPLEMLNVEITVTKTASSNGTVQEVCKSKTPMKIPLIDIRGRQEEWFYCQKRDENENLICNASYMGKPAKIVVRPSMVIRDWKPGAALDANMHVLLIENKNPNHLRDTFIRSLQFDLSTRNITLDGSSGDFLSESEAKDDYQVRTKIYR